MKHSTRYGGRPAFSAGVGLAVGALLTGLVLPFVVEADPRTELGGPSEATRDGVVVSEPAGDVSDERAARVPVQATGGTATGATSQTPRRPAGEPSENTDVAAGRAADVGVSKDAIKVGVLIFELGSVADFGLGVPGADPAAQEAYFQATIDAVNEEGGVAGRRIEPVYRRFEPGPNGDSEQAACLALTEDAKVFLVFAAPGFVGDAALCVTEQHGTLLLGTAGESEEYYERSRGLLFTTNMSADRTGRNMASRAHDQGLLRDAVIGIVMDTLPESRVPTERGLIAQLERLGYEPAHVTELPADSSTAASQMPLAISQMRAKGVNLVFFTASAVRSNLWFNEADAQRFRPLHIVSDLNTLANDFAVQSAPPTLRAIAYTALRHGEQRAGRPEQPEQAECRRRYEQQSGQRMERSDTGSGYTTLSNTCALVNVFVRSAHTAGPDLTRTSFMQAMPQLGAWSLPGIGGTVAFTGKNHGANFMRRLAFVGSCRCWHAGDDFSPVAP